MLASALVAYPSARSLVYPRLLISLLHRGLSQELAGKNISSKHLSKMLLTLRVAAPWRWLGVQLAYPAFLSLRVRFINLSFFSKNDAFGFVRNQGKIFFEKKM